MSRSDFFEQAVSMQERICTCTAALPESVQELMTQLRGRLITAQYAGLLTNSPEEISKKLLKKDEPIGRRHFDAQHLDPAEFPPERTAAIFGGVKNQHRVKTLPHFGRDDGAWFDFSLTVFKGPKGGLTLLSYDFEIRFPSGDPVAYLRLDLNSPSNRRVDKMRCHLHPSTEDDELCVPAPWMQPVEVIDLFVHGFRHQDAPRHRKGEDARTTNRREALYDAIEHILEARGLALSADVAGALRGLISTSPNPAPLFGDLIQRAVLVDKPEELLDK